MVRGLVKKCIFSISFLTNPKTLNSYYQLKFPAYVKPMSPDALLFAGWMK